MKVLSWIQKQITLKVCLCVRLLLPNGGPSFNEFLAFSIIKSTGVTIYGTWESIRAGESTDLPTTSLLLMFHSFSAGKGWFHCGQITRPSSLHSISHPTWGCTSWDIVLRESCKLHSPCTLWCFFDWVYNVISNTHPSLSTRRRRAPNS